MASDIRFSTAACNAFLDTLNATLGASSLLRFYSGTKPATADAALSGNTLLAELTLNATEFQAASGRVVVANSIGTDINADATGTCTFASFVKSDGTRVIDVTVGEAADSADITVDNKNFQINADIAVTAFSLGLNL
jgi:hypothetical protein